MLKIDTSVISANSGYPGLANNTALGTNPGVGLDFIQAEIMQIGEALSLALVSDQSKATILATIPGGVGYSGSGYVYYGGEIFYYPNIYLLAIPYGRPYLSASWIANPVDTGVNQTVLSDSSQVSMHNQRTISFAFSATQNTGNLPDYNEWIQTRMVTDEANIAAITALPTPTDAAPILNNADWDIGLNRLVYWKDTLGYIHIQGAASYNGGGGTTVLFQLPAGYRPKAGTYAYGTVVQATPSASSVAYNIQIDSSGNINMDLPTSGAITYAFVIPPFATV